MWCYVPCRNSRSIFFFVLPLVLCCFAAYFNLSLFQFDTITLKLRPNEAHIKQTTRNMRIPYSTSHPFVSLILFFLLFFRCCCRFGFRLKPNCGVRACDVFVGVLSVNTDIPSVWQISRTHLSDCWEENANHCEKKNQKNPRKLLLFSFDARSVLRLMHTIIKAIYRSAQNYDCKNYIMSTRREQASLHIMWLLWRDLK